MNAPAMTEIRTNSSTYESRPILPRPEVSDEMQNIYERSLGAAALLRPIPNEAQDRADKVRRHYQYGASDSTSSSHDKVA